MYKHLVPMTHQSVQQFDSMAIIIDCWASAANEHRALKETYQRIVNFVTNIKPMTLILVATYPDYTASPIWSHPRNVQAQHDHRYFLAKEAPIWEESRRWFSGTEGIETPKKIARWWKLFESMDIFYNAWHEGLPETRKANYGPFLSFPLTYPGILQMPVKGATLMGAWTMEQVRFLCNQHFPNIQDVYYLGGSLHECLLNRPVGIKPMIKSIRNQKFSSPKRVLIPNGCVFGLSPDKSHNNYWVINGGTPEVICVSEVD